AAIRHYLLPPDVAVAHMRDDVVPGIVAGLLAKRAGPLVVHRPRSALLILLLESDLQSIELSVLVVAVVRDALGPAAHARGNVGFAGGRDVVGIGAGLQAAAVVALQEVSIRDRAGVA